ncbi:protein aar2 homolog [Phtheirospermum japonicum]|uniref:Protein aar2 homolog n=1 Tax=Phtheirospermum japonicum TaxID=374723 RepID=A0A830AXS4_9LAMI|nr:protein aar2 homolog [Phtheirospermum japonicum]
MDSETALELVKHGATLLLLDVPQYTLIGVDTQMYSSGPNFKGVKMIPPGIHFIYYSSSNREGIEFSPVVGFFIDIKASQVIVRKWDQKEERFVKLPDDEEERYSFAVQRLEFDKHLGPYSLSHYGDWKQLSNYISKDTIEHIEPIGGEITIACEPEMAGMFSKTAMERTLADQLKNSEFPSPVEKPQKGGCYYTAIPRVIKQKGMSGKELTDLNLDKADLEKYSAIFQTQLLESILMKEYGGDEDALLAELQFAFIAFLMGQSLEAFMQWKLLVSLLLGCIEAFIKVIYYQLKYGFLENQKDIGAKPEGVSALLDESWLSSDSFLHLLCKDFFSLVLEAPVVDGDLLSWTRRLRVLLEDSFGWQIQQNSAADGIYFDEDDEYAPVVEILDDAECSNT